MKRLILAIRAFFDTLHQRSIPHQVIDKSGRITWNELWTTVVLTLSKRSVDIKHKVGCIIVNEDNTSILSLGYNGDYKGGSNKRLSTESGQSGFIHAEENALIKLNTSDKRDKKMYLTHSPCYECASKIINADTNIKTIYYIKEYLQPNLTKSGIDICRENGIVIQQIK